MVGARRDSRAAGRGWAAGRGVTFMRTLSEQWGFEGGAVCTRGGRSRSLDVLPRGVDGTRAATAVVVPDACGGLVAGRSLVRRLAPAARRRVWETRRLARVTASRFFIVRQRPSLPRASAGARWAKLAYCRLYPAYALAAVDALFLVA